MRRTDLVVWGLIACGWLPALVGRAEDEAQQAALRYQQAQRAAQQGQSARAVELAGEAIALQSKLAEAYYLRGREQFRLGKIAQSVSDFDRFVGLRPALESRQWERGIAYYYHGQFAKGAKQFALYQTFHNNDVENSVWRYLCMARSEGVAKARAAILPIENDRRVPMMQVYRLYRGELQPEDVLAAVDADEPEEEVRAGRLFYAHLYLGLYYEAQGKRDLADKYIRLAAAPALRNHPRINSYMWDVAHVHAQSLPGKPGR